MNNSFFKYFIVLTFIFTTLNSCIHFSSSSQEKFSYSINGVHKLKGTTTRGLQDTSGESHLSINKDIEIDVAALNKHQLFSTSTFNDTEHTTNINTNLDTLQYQTKTKTVLQRDTFIVIKRRNPVKYLLSGKITSTVVRTGEKMEPLNIEITSHFSDTITIKNGRRRLTEKMAYYAINKELLKKFEKSIKETSKDMIERDNERILEIRKIKSPKTASH